MGHRVSKDLDVITGTVVFHCTFGKAGDFRDQNNVMIILGEFSWLIKQLSNYTLRCNSCVPTFADLLNRNYSMQTNDDYLYHDANGLPFFQYKNIVI